MEDGMHAAHLPINPPLSGTRCHFNLSNHSSSDATLSYAATISGSSAKKLATLIRYWSPPGQTEY